MNGFTSPRSSISSRRSRVEPAPRVVPQPENQVAVRPPLLLAILFAPFSLVYSLFSRWFRFVGWIFPPLGRLFGPGGGRRGAASGRRPLAPRENAARFIREFEEEYGENRLPFYEGAYAQSFDLAKKNLQFLLVILVSPEHDETASFIRDTLLSQEVVDFILNPDNNIILWGGNVQDSEAYQVSTSLNCTKFPFTGLIVHTPQVSSTAMGIAVRIVGPTPPTEFVAKLRKAIETHSEPLTRVRAQRAEQQATRSIREQQNSAYERSLAIDRERARKKKEEAELKAREEKEAEERRIALALFNESRAQWRRWRASSLAPEPATEDKTAVRIRITMPNADRVMRSFPADAPIEELYAFVDCYDVLQSGESTEAVEKPQDYTHEYEFQLRDPLPPRTVYDVKAGGTIKERIGRSGNLIVERTNVDDDEDDEEEE